MAGILTELGGVIGFLNIRQNQGLSLYLAKRGLMFRLEHLKIFGNKLKLRMKDEQLSNRV